MPNPPRVEVKGRSGFGVAMFSGRTGFSVPQNPGIGYGLPRARIRGARGSGCKGFSVPDPGASARPPVIVDRGRRRRAARIVVVRAMQGPPGIGRPEAACSRRTGFSVPECWRRAGCRRRFRTEGGFVFMVRSLTPSRRRANDRISAHRPARARRRSQPEHDGKQGRPRGSSRCPVTALDVPGGFGATCPYRPAPVAP